MLREDDVAIDGDVEHASVAGNDLGLEAELPRNHGRQTGSLRAVVSTDAIGNGDSHDTDTMINPGGASGLPSVERARTYMVVEHFKGGDAAPVYQRFRDRGRLAPAGLDYVSSWVDVTLQRCYQVMQTEDPALLHEWMSHWSDLVDFEVHEVMSSARAAEQVLGSPR